MQNEFNTFQGFDFSNAAAYLWVFKRSSTQKKFNTFYVRTDDVINTFLKEIAENERGRITEFSPYTYIAQTNENSCLTSTVNGNDFSDLKIQVDRPEPENPVRSIKDLRGAEGYVAKFVLGNQTIYAVKKSASSWKTAYSKKLVNMIFQNGELTAAENNGFSIEKNFDFYCVDGVLFISGKKAFESAMSYRDDFSRAFVSLQGVPEFSNLFTDMQPLVNYVGNNSIQLRRMAVIEQKGLYASPNFIGNLRNVNATRGWGINFDPANQKIIPCDVTAKVIMQVLLDHRLMSEVTSHVYDVPDTIQV